jgi:hypothetical protein
MRIARIKVPTSDRDSVYHVMTRTVNGAFLLDDRAKETLRKQLWQGGKSKGSGRCLLIFRPAGTVRKIEVCEVRTRNFS